MKLFDLNDTRSHRWLALVLFIVTVVSRIPFASQYLYHWDSVNMAFGMIHFDVLNGAPQFPGYIVYVAMAQLFNILFANPQTTMVVISIISSGLSASVMFYLGRDMFNPVTGLIGALILISSPLFWFYGEIALPHSLDLFAIVLSVWLLYRIMIGQTGLIWVTTVVLALVGGFRQQDLLFLGPLTIFACYRIGVMRIIKALILGAVISVAWFIPLMALSGGLQAYMTGSSAFTASFWATTSIFSGAGEFGLKRNILEKLIPYTLYAWSLSAVFVLYWLAELPSKWRSWLTSRKVRFLLLWVAPTLGFYAIIHMGQQGLVFVFIPAFWLVSAEGLYRLLCSRPVLLRAATAAVVAVSAGVFILAPTNPLGEGRFKILTFDTLRQHDSLLHDQITAIKESFLPENTLLVAANWRHVQYYLPEYHFARFDLGVKYEVAEGQSTGADYVDQPVSAEALGLQSGKDWQVVVVDEELRSFTTDKLDDVTLLDGFALAYLKANAQQVYWTDGKTFGVREPG